MPREQKMLTGHLPTVIYHQDAQGTSTQSLISPSILEYEHERGVREQERMCSLYTFHDLIFLRAIYSGLAGSMMFHSERCLDGRNA